MGSKNICKKIWLNEHARIFVISLIIIIAVIIGGNLILQTIYTPTTPNSVLNSYVNAYYTPISTSNVKNPAACTNEYVNFGSSFSLSTSSMPSSSACIFAEGKSFKYYKNLRTTKGSCADLGQQYTIGGELVLTKLNLIKMTTGEFAVCTNYARGGYTFTIFSQSTQLCKVKYTKPEVKEIEGKYYCDGKNIYVLPCGSGSKKTVKTCKLGCESTTKNVDEGSNVPVVKCIGEYEPNIKVCSSDGKILYTTDSAGNLNTQSCSTCTNGRCTVYVPPVVTTCTLIVDNKGTNNIFLSNDEVMPDYGYWVLEMLKTKAPYSEYTFNLYKESPKGGCEKTIASRVRDIRISFEDIPGSPYGWGIPPRNGKAGEFIIDIYKSVRKWDFLLFHELGHIFTRRNHTNDGSIMDANGGNRQYTEAQIKVIRENLNAVK